MRAPLDSRQLQAFVTLARTGSFTRTAREMFVTQSAISHAIKALEGDIGCRLLDRLGRKAILTEAGEHLLHHAERVLREMAAARSAIEQLARWGRQRLRLGASATLCQYLLPAVLRELKASFPQSLISIEPGDSHESVRLLEENRVDLAIALNARLDERFEFIPLFTDELVFVASPLHAWAKAGTAAREDLPRQNVIIYGKTTHTWRLIDDYFRREGIVLNAAIDLRSMEAIKELVKLDLGVSILAPWVARAELKEGSLVALPLGRRKLKREWGVVHRRHRRLTIAEETFIGLCRAAAEQLRADQPGT